MYIYYIDNYSDRFYFPKKAFYYNTDLDIRNLYKFISSNYQKNSIYTDEKNIYPAKGNIIYAKKIEEGYEIKVSVKKEGIFEGSKWLLKIIFCYKKSSGIRTMAITNKNSLILES